MGLVNSKIRVGVVGVTGRMGVLLSKLIMDSDAYECGPSFSKSRSNVSLSRVFADNDYVIDFSSKVITEDVLRAAINNPKPLIICTTGWSEGQASNLLTKLAFIAPVFITANTSIGAYLQYYFTLQLAGILKSEYDIDIIEKHHRHKVDIPSGTVKSLVSGIKDIKERTEGVKYTNAAIECGPRPENLIGIAAIRSGNISGDHEVMFTNADECITIKHTALNRQVFAKGAIRILDWLRIKNPPHGIYRMHDTLDAVHNR